MLHAATTRSGCGTILQCRSEDTGPVVPSPPPALRIVQTDCHSDCHSDCRKDIVEQNSLSISAFSTTSEHRVWDGDVNFGVLAGEGIRSSLSLWLFETSQETRECCSVHDAGVRRHTIDDLMSSTVMCMFPRGQSLHDPGEIRAWGGCFSGNLLMFTSSAQATPPHQKLCRR